MSVSVEADVSSPLSEGQSGTLDRISKSSSDSQSLCKTEDIEAGHDYKDEKSEPSTPKLHPMAFTIDFGEAKQFDNRRLEELAKKSQARHQRVQSMSASLTKPAPTPQKTSMSAKLPRKAQGYNSEGYFSSDQEDSGLSGSVKLKSSPLAQSTHITSPITNRHIKSPINDNMHPKKPSKSPIVDGIMSRSDNFTLRQGLNLPLKNPTSSYVRDVHRTPSYGNLSSTYQPKHDILNIIDQSPDGIMLTDISSPELDILTPDNGLSTPEFSKSPLIRKSRASSETPDLFKKCVPKVEPLYIDDDVDRQSDNSSTGTYTIEGDNYTEEQKARMSIDRSFGTDLLTDAVDETLMKRSNERDPELVFDYPNQRVITKEPRRDVGLRSPLTNQSFDIPTKISKDKNVLEISCCYESPTENDLAAQTSKQIKSTRSYLEKIKNRVRTITEKTFAKSPPKHDEDLDIGSFTSVTTSGVLSSKNPPKLEIPKHRRCSLTKSEIDQTDYVHRLSRESSVPVSLPSNKNVLEEAKFESTALINAQKALRDDSGVSSDITPDKVVGKLSYLSLNRCKGDKTWIQEWAESVKKYNNNGLKDDATFVVEDRPPTSPRNFTGKSRSPLGGTPTKIPSPVGTLLHRRTPDLIPVQDTESYLVKTQNAITNLQAKLQSSRTNNFSNIPPQLTSSLISEKTAVSRLPVSQLSRSNSLNYRLRRKDNSGDSSPLRSPGHYVITGSTKVPESTKILLNSASKSLDTDRRKNLDSNMNSPSSEKGLLSNSSDDKTLSNRPTYDVDAILSPHRKIHSRHKSFDGKNSPEFFGSDFNNANQTVCLKTVLKNNALEAKYPKIDQTRCQGDVKKSHQRVFSDGRKPNAVAFGSSIKRSSSFNTVNKNNNYIDPIRHSRRSSGHSEEYKDYSDESDTGSFDKSQDVRYKRTVRGRIDSPDLKSIAPANSPRCPNTPEMPRKFGPGLVRNSVRVTNKERVSSPRIPEPTVREDRSKPNSHQSRRISEPTRQAVLNRLTKSRSSTREFQPKTQEKGQKKPSQHRSSSALASKEAEYTNWKKRSSYDPMKAAQEGRRRQLLAKRQENKDDLSSPSHSSPVHRSQSFHTTNIADLETLDYSSEEDDQMLATLPVDPMITSTHSDILDLRNRDLRRKAVTNDVVLARDYVTNFQVNQPTEKPKRRDTDKRKTYIIDDITPTKENIDFLPKTRDEAIDKRKTFILDSDTNSTTNGSSPRNSSIFSHEKNSLTTGTSDTEGESGTESAPVVMRHPGGKRTPAQAKQRYSGDYSMSSSTTSIGQQRRPKDIQPRYLDISKYKSESSPKNFLRRDPSKTYVGVLNCANSVSKGSAQHYEMEQKKQELEKWKRRASYDPRKAAALGKTNKAPPKTASSVLRSQSFHGPVLVSTSLRYQPPPTQIVESYDHSSDNDF